jgi:hypothetical protein
VFITTDLGGKDMHDARRSSPWKGNMLVIDNLVVVFFFFGGPLHEQYEIKQ